MAKNFRRMFAMVLVLCMCVSAMPLQALAETTQETETIVNENGDPIGEKEVIITVVPSGSGNGTQTTTDTAWSTQETVQQPSGSSESSQPAANTEKVIESSGESHEQETVESTGEQTAISGSSTTQQETIITDTQKQEDQLLSKTPEKMESQGDAVTEWDETPEAPVIPETGEGDWKPTGEGNYEKVDGSQTSEVETQEEVQVQVDTKTGTSILIDVPSSGDNSGSKVVGGINVVENAFTDLDEDDQAAIQALIEAAADPEKETATVEYTVNGTKITVTAAVDENGKIIRDELGNVSQYTVTRETEQAVDLDNIHDGNGHAPVGKVESTKQGTVSYTKPEGYEEGEKPIKNEKDEVIGTEKTVAIMDEVGNIIGYEITRIVESTAPGEDLEPAQQPDAKEDKFELPAKPVIPNPKDDETLSGTAVVTEIKDGDEVIGYTTVDNGITTTSKVTEEKDENGNVIGYTTTTVVTDAEGNELSFESNTIYGTEYTYTKTESWDDETQKLYDIEVEVVKGITRTDEVEITTNGVHTNVKDVSQDIYQLVETETGTYFIYEGKVYAVTGTNTLKATDLTGGIDLSQYGTTQGDDDDDLRLQYEANAGFRDNFVGSNFGYADTQNNEWKWDGFGMVSDFEAAGNTDHRVRLFKLKDGNQIRYAYCVELGADIYNGTVYGSSEYGKDETGQTTGAESDAPWVGATGTIKQLRSVALNGFWGTEDGLGSLQAVKDLMLRNGFTKEEADSLTPGMALTATQVAIWYFGAQNSDEFGSVGTTDAESDTFGLEYFNTETNITDQSKVDVVNKLRNLLVRLANDESGAGKAEVLTAKNTFTQAGFVIHDKVVVETEEERANHVNYDNNEGNDVYNTDVQFKLDVSTSSFNGDLIVKVMVGNDVVGAGRLAGSSKETDLIGNLLFDKIYPDENGVFTIPGLQLAENVIIDLKLEGTQHLDDGVYVFNHATLQDFISLSKLENKVNFNMKMEFNVEDPGTATVDKTHTSWQENKDVNYQKTDKGTQKHNGTETTVEKGQRKEIYGTITITETETQNTGAESAWRSLYLHPEETSSTLRMARGGGEPAPQPQVFRLNNQDNLVEIPEEPVPLATPVVTGDNSNLWIAVILVSLFGMVVINITGRKGKYEAF